MRNEDEIEKLRLRIAELEISEKKLLQTKTLFQGLFEYDPDAIVVVNSEGSIVQINTQAEKMFGYSREEVLGNQVEIFVPERFRELHIEQRKSYMFQPHIRFLGTELELYGQRKDGSEFPADIMLGPLETEEGTVVLAIIRDITEHKRMEDALLASEAKYRSIFENAVEGIFRIAIKGGIQAANPALARLLGYSSPEELITDVADFRKIYVDPGSRLEFTRMMHAFGVVTDFEAQAWKKDRRKIWISINARALRDARGNMVGFEGMAMDITSRKRAAKNFEMLIESAPDAIVTVDRNFNILLVNTRAENIFGYTREELLDKPYDILIPERFRKKHAEHCTGYFLEPVIKTMALHIGALAKRKDGSEFPVEINMSPMETEQGITVLTFIRDISERIAKPQRI